MFSFKLATIALIAASAFAAPADVATSPNNLAKRITHTGQATWFEVGLGACGWNNVDSDYIVAMNSDQYGSGNNCGQYLEITNTANGNTAIAQQVDECPTCDFGSLDMSPSLFEALAGSGGLDEGVFPISWHFKKRD